MKEIEISPQDLDLIDHNPKHEETAKDKAPQEPPKAPKRENLLETL